MTELDPNFSAICLKMLARINELQGMLIKTLENDSDNKPKIESLKMVIRELKQIGGFL